VTLNLEVIFKTAGSTMNKVIWHNKIAKGEINNKKDLTGV
jgi:hypothetical protein